MPRKKKVDSWGFSCLGYDCNGEGEVIKIWCKTCREFYSNNDVPSESKKSFIKGQVQKYVDGTTVVKKNNFVDHVKNSVTHRNAVLRSAEGRNENTANGQRNIVTCVRGLNAELRDQLVMKFQLAHFIANRGSSFNLYANFVKFERDIHNVKLGSGFAKKCLFIWEKVLSKITLPHRLMNRKLYIIAFTMMGLVALKQWTKKNSFL